MDLQNLKEHHEELLSFMENNGYSSTYIRRFREEINRILAKADSHDWQSYRDVYLDYLKAPHSKDYLRNKRTIIGALEQFDDFGRMPDGRSRHTLFERGSYHLLCSEFRELIDFYRIYEKKRGKKESTIRGEALNAASFLHQMQQRGAQLSGCNNGRGCPVILSRRRWFFAKKLFLQEKHCSSVQGRA